MKTYFVYVIQGYESIGDHGQLNDVVTYEIIADSYDQALKKAQKCVSKKLYRLSMVIEKYV